MKVWLRVLRGLTLAGVVLGGGIAVSGTATVLMTVEAQAQASSIIVEGNRRVEADTIRSYFRSGGRGLDALAIDEGLKALYATGLFEDVKISQAGGRLKRYASDASAASPGRVKPRFWKRDRRPA